MKNILKYIPVVGWSFWMSEYICVHRSFDKDKKIIDRRLKELSFYDEHFWVIIIIIFGSHYLKALQLCLH